MEPYHALGIAVAVVEFLDFASILVDEQETEVGQTSYSLTTQELGQPFNNILRLNASFKRLRGYGSEVGSGCNSEHARTLNRILLECSGIAQQLVDTPQSLKVNRRDRSKSGTLTKGDKKAPRNGSEWISFRQALTTVWTSEYIKTLKSRLLTYRQQLAISVVACLNSHVTVGSETGAGLNSSEVKIVEVLSLYRGETEPHGEVLAAIITLNDGKVQSILPHSASSLKAWTTAPKQTAMRIHQPNAGDEFAVFLSSFTLEHLARNILSSLHFRQIKDRVNQLQDAHKATFNCIFHSTNEANKPWSDFPQWLESGHGCFWINGKAGSGKSALMKYILEDQRTLSHLNKWTGDAQLVTASYFFWNLGSPVQKTQEGLLRSLLHDVLERRPELIPLIMPELCKEIMQSKKQDHLKDPSLAQLKQSFRLLVQQASSSCRMFFHIGGVDEFEGDSLELINLLTDTTSDHVKFLISSRQIPACTERFASGPGLRLHDLTRDDMVNYCEEIIGKHLARHEYIPDRSSLIEQVVAKSSGVFLWLFLVVRSVLQGLQDKENITQLRKRLDELPTELTELHAHLIRKIPVQFRSQASEIFQTYSKCHQIEQDIRGHPILTIQFSFVGESWDTVLNARFKKLSRKQEKAREEDINRRLREQCCGFLEAQKRSRRRRVKSLAEHLLASSSKVTRPTHIGFIHRIVAEFIRDPKVWAEIKSWNKDFDPYQGLFKSCIMMAKSFPTSPEVVHPRGSLVWESMYAGLRYAQLAEREGRPIPVKYLDAFDEVLGSHWDKALVYCLDAGRYETVAGKHWSTMFFRMSGEDGEKAGGLDCTGAVSIGGGGNRFRYLSSASEKCYAVIGQTEGLGFLRVAVVYGLGSYIRVKMAEGAATELVRFWRDLLMSSFPLRVKMRASTALSSSLLDGAIHGGGSVMDCEDALTVWNIFLVELCCSRDLARMKAGQAVAMGILASEFLDIYLASRPWTAVSGRFEELVVQLGGMLQSKASCAGLYERLHEGVVSAAAEGEKGKRSKMNVVVVSRELAPSASEGSASGTGSIDTATPVSSRENLQLALARPHVILGEGLTHMLKVGKGNLRLPMAKRRAQWREWELRGRLSGMNRGGI